MMRLRNIAITTSVLLALSISAPTSIYANTPNISDNTTISSNLGQVGEGKSTIYLDDDATLAFFSQLSQQVSRDYQEDFVGVNLRTKIAWFDETSLNTIEFEKRQEVIDFILNEIKNSKLPPKGKNKLYNFIRSQDLDSNKVLRNLEKDVYADLQAGKEYTSFLHRPISSILGVISLITFIALTFRLVLDIIYMTTRSVQSIIDYKFGDKKFYGKIISNAARHGVKERDKGEYDPFALLTYFRRTIISNLLIALSFLWLARGYIILFIAELSNAFSSLW